MKSRRTVFVLMFLVCLQVSTGVSVAEEMIFFSSNRAVSPSTLNSHIYMLKPDGTGLTQLTAGNFFDEAPELSPDGHTLVFTRFENPELTCSHLWTLDLATNTLTQITSQDREFNPTWYPDGQAIYFNRNGSSCGGGGPTDIWVFDLGTNTEAQLSPSGSRSLPSVHPGGIFVTYNSIAGTRRLLNFPGDGEMDPDLSLPKDEDQRNQEYSSDGTQIAFDSETTGLTYFAPVSLFTGTPQMGAQTPLTAPPLGNWRHPSFSPDGTYLVINQVVGSDHTLFKVELSTGTSTQLKGPDSDIDVNPTWGDLRLDSVGPLTSNVMFVPNPVEVGYSTVLSANIDDSTTGGLAIAGVKPIPS